MLEELVQSRCPGLGLGDREIGGEVEPGHPAAAAAAGSLLLLLLLLGQRPEDERQGQDL